MSSDVFDALFRERVDVFRAAFSAVSTEVFFDASTNRLRHSGEYGTYRESIVRDFLRFIVPRRFDISTGFMITTMNDVSTQCDIVVFERGMTPLYQEGDRQRFFPIESAFCIGEVKSTLSKSQLAAALNKLATVKALGERITHPSIPGRYPSQPFDPINHPYDLVPSILICQDFNFDFNNIENELNSLYDSNVLHRHKHNMVLSLQDGLLSYADPSGVNLPYTRLRAADLKHRFTSPGTDGYAHFRLFGSYMFMLAEKKTLLYPEFSDYISPIRDAVARTEA